MNKIKVAKATINGRESLFLITLDKKRLASLGRHTQSPQLHILAQYTFLLSN